MNLNGWEIDLQSLYGRQWADREKFFMMERLFEAPGGDVAVVLFGIGEVGLNKEVGRLAVFRNKAAPVLLLPPGKELFWYEGASLEPVRFDESGNSAYVSEYLADYPKRGYLGVRERVVDLSTGLLVPIPTEESTAGPTTPWYRRLSLRLWLVSMTLAVVFTLATVLAPIYWIHSLVSEHRRDVRLLETGTKYLGKVTESGRSCCDPAEIGWSRVRSELEAGGRTAEFIVYEERPVGSPIEIFYDTETGQGDGVTFVERKVRQWPWTFALWLLLMTPISFWFVFPFCWWLWRRMKGELGVGG